jgi:pimeloyl-ACP methyl ester carboxylesterase
MANSTGHSRFHNVRGISYHVREWGDARDPAIFLLHGWMDVSASFQFLVESFAHTWHVVAPDWRGFGLSEWAQDGYWFPDYLADLDAILNIYSDAAPAQLAGHSLGGIVACAYAGTRPERVAAVVSLEGFGLPRMAPEEIPGRVAQWLYEVAHPRGFGSYRSFDEVVLRLKQNNPRLADEKAQFLARHWAKQLDSGEVVLAADPRHKRISPIPHRLEDAIACWKRVAAPVLWVSGDGSHIRAWLKDTPEEYAERTRAFANFSEANVADAGHMLHHDQPQAVARIVEAFLLANPFSSKRDP